MTAGRAGAKIPLARAVALGGGHGMARTLRALPAVAQQITAIVTVADDGGSSGRLRRDLAVLPPGDLRMALLALARDEDIAAILNYRFDRGELAGHSLGNLILIAVQDLSDGDLVAALDRVAALLRIPGRVLPCTTEGVTLHAKTAAGQVTGQASIAATPGLTRLWLAPHLPTANPEARAAIAEAQLLVLGPGSIFTSLLPNLLVAGITDAIMASGAPVVFIANLREQPGETEGMTLLEHLEVIATHVPALRIDAIIAHNGPAPSGDGAPLAVDVEGLRAYAPRVIVTDLLDGEDGHDPATLAAELAAFVRAP